jgi:hypothetical protein
MPHGYALESHTAKIISGFPVSTPIPNSTKNPIAAQNIRIRKIISVQDLSLVGIPLTNSYFIFYIFDP